MWIRSQDKKRLCNANHIGIAENKIFGSNIPAQQHSAMQLGTYETLERALEVLDEIQLQLTNGSHGSYSTILETQQQTSYGENIYQMPEK